MNEQTSYRAITREQFLFNEMRIVARLLLQGKSEEEILREVVEDNLLQYPTEVSLRNITRVCLRRFKEADSNELIDIVANGTSEASKQACLFLMMNYYRLVWEFMVGVVGEKYSTLNYSLTRADFNSFFTRLQEQNDEVASWSELTINKCKQVLKKILVENGYLDNTKSEVLNNVLIDLLVKEAIEHVGKKEALVAFNYIR